MRLTYLVILGMVVFTTPLIAQSDSITEVSFIYDDAGNRIEREITYYEVQFKSSSSTDIEEKEITSDKGLTVYPNPASHTLFVTLNQEVMDENDRKISIYDSLGKLVSQVLAPQETNQIDVSSLMNGTYILRLTYGSKHIEWIIIKT